MAYAAVASRRIDARYPLLNKEYLIQKNSEKDWYQGILEN